MGIRGFMIKKFLLDGKLFLFLLFLNISVVSFFAVDMYFKKTALNPYIDELYGEAQAYGVVIPEISEKFNFWLVGSFEDIEDIKPNSIGLCYVSGERRYILIKESYFYRVGSEELKATLLHEMGHCFWEAAHTKNPNDLMYTHTWDVGTNFLELRVNFYQRLLTGKYQRISFQ